MANIKKSSGDGGPLSDPLQEAMRRIQDAEGTASDDLDLSKLRLGPVLHGEWNGWEALRRLDKLRYLNLGDNQITDLAAEGWAALGRLAGLNRLDLDGNQMNSLPVEGWQAIGQLAKLRALDLSGNVLRHIPEAGWVALRRVAQLLFLNLTDNRIADIPVAGWQALGELTNLKYLYIGSNTIAIPKEGWKALGRLAELESLSLHSNKIGRIPADGWGALGRLAKLKHLFISANEIGDIPTEGWEALGRLGNLQTLVLDENKLSTFPAKGWGLLSKLEKLETLSLSGNEIGGIPMEGWEALGRLANMKMLFLVRNEITTIPTKGWEALSRLTKLEDLNLSHNRISDITPEEWVTGGPFPNLQRLNLLDNPLPEDLLAAASRGPKSLFEYLEAARLRAAHPRTVKLMLLGEPASGKTTLVEALNGNPRPCDPNRPETVGVDIQRIEKKSPQDGLPLYLSTWDFAGQHMEYATHQFFLKPGGVYLILWKARLGSDYGQRDLWYWLGLLKMRVKDPEYLLVTTHTGKTPAGLDLHEVNASYPGCKGHFEVDLCDGTGVAALEAKILELALASPSIKAVWPAPWLAVRDAVRGMRAGRPYVSAETFWRICAKHEVDEERAQRDLADQLDKLGEIVYYVNDPLSRLVILDPTWVTELVAKVVRDKKVRDQDGTLNAADLDRIWGDLPANVRDHLENLMDEYDLVYKTAVHQHAQSSIVVEALPPAPEEIRILDIAANRPQAEMIYRFPSLARHLPPGVPTWAFARSRRYMKPGAGPWRNAARFEDADTNSEAIIFSSEVEREVRLRVAADYPPYFFGVLDSILRDTYKRYPGAQPETRIPCPCQPGCKYSYPQATVLKRKRDGKPDVSCEHSGEDVAIGTLLEGSAPSHTEAGIRATLASMRRQLSALQNGQNEELVKTCPSMFTLAPAKSFKLLDTYPEYATQQEELELTLYCEWEKEWHATQHSVYRFRPEQAWFGVLKEKWVEFVRVTKRVAPLVSLSGSLVGAPAVGVAMKALAEKAEKMSVESEKDLSGALAKDLGIRERSGVIDLEARHLLARLIGALDKARGWTHPEFGGLHPYVLKEDGRLLWLCAEHRRQYESGR